MLGLIKTFTAMIISAAVLVIAVSVGLSLPSRNNNAALPEYVSGDRVMTLGDARKLAAKGDRLTFADFREFAGKNHGTVPGRYIVVYEVAGGYRMLVHSNPTGKPDAVYFKSKWEYPRDVIDIRHEDLEAYLLENPSQDEVTESQALAIMNALKETMWSTNPPTPEYEPLGSSSEPGEECWLFDTIRYTDDGERYSTGIWAMGKQSGTMYNAYREDMKSSIESWYKWSNDLGIAKPYMTLDDVRGLAAKGTSVTDDDLYPYRGEPTPTGILHVYYPINGGEYALTFTQTVKNGLFLVGAANAGIDIRYYDVDKFVADGTHELAHPLPEAVPTSYKPRVWLDYFHGGEMPWDSSIDLTIDEFPNVTFTWTSDKVTDGEKILIWGMPVWNVYLADLNGDELPELCATVSAGSGIVDERVIVCDYANGRQYELVSRMFYNYSLSLEDDRLVVTQFNNEYPPETQATGGIAIIDGDLVSFGLLQVQP